MSLKQTEPLSLPVVDELHELDGVAWHLWTGWGDKVVLVRALGDGRHVAVVPMLFTWAVVASRNLELIPEDRWCFNSLETAVAAATVWTGEGEPAGWHRHVQSGRRRPDGDASQEYISP